MVPRGFIRCKNSESTPAPVKKPAGDPAKIAELDQSARKQLGEAMSKAGADLVESLSDTLESLAEDIPDEKARYRSALKLMVRQGHPIQAILQDFDKCIGALEEDNRLFSGQLKDQMEKRVGSRTKAVADFDAQIQKLNDEIAAKRAEITRLTGLRDESRAMSKRVAELLGLPIPKTPTPAPQAPVVRDHLIVSKDLHKLAWYGYTSAMRWLTNFIVKTDPIGIMKSYIVQLKANLEEISKALGALKGQARSLERKISEKSEAVEASMGKASYAKTQKGRENDVRLEMRKSKRAESLSMTYQGLLNKIRTHSAVMEKVQEAANFMVLDIQDTVEGETEKRAMIRSSYKAMTASRAILAAGQQREMYDMAMESVTQDYYSKLGEIEQFMDDSKSFIQGMDLENGACDAQSLAKLEEWEHRSTALLEGGTGKTKFRVSPATGSSSDDTEEDDSVTEKRQSYADLFDKLDK